MIDMIINPRRRATALCSPTGCHAAGQGILMFDGSVRQVEYVEVGDLLMGPDSRPRRVLELHQGIEGMVRVSPVKGSDFEINRGHILSLVRTNDGTKQSGIVVNLPLSHYLFTSRTFKRIHKLYRVGVDFPPSYALPIEPYFIGILLGDGCISDGGLRVCSADKEIVDYLIQLSDRVGLEFSTNGIVHSITQGKNAGRSRNPLTSLLRVLGLHKSNSGSKFIPLSYKTASRSDRLTLLAGLIDTDGSLSGNCYDYVSKSRTLSSDVCFLSRSLGLAAYMSRCEKSCQTGSRGTYYRVAISGELSDIPCRLARKLGHTRLQKKNVLVTGIRGIQELGEGRYFGFTLSGDGLYLLDDFTVTHNSGKSPAYVAGALPVQETYLLRDRLQRLTRSVDGRLQNHRHGGHPG